MITSQTAWFFYSSISTTLRPLYMPQLGHAWWGRRASPQWEQGVGFGAVIFWWVRRLSRFDLDFLRLGTGMSKNPF
jgi:hypothetical protein